MYSLIDGSAASRSRKNVLTTLTSCAFAPSISTVDLLRAGAVAARLERGAQPQQRPHDLLLLDPVQGLDDGHHQVVGLGPDVLLGDASIRLDAAFSRVQSSDQTW